jgi:hypothetical protein
MSVPNHFDVVQLVFQTGNFDLSTHDGCGLFTEACARELFKGDPNFGHLKKRPAQNQYNWHAVDAVLYRPTGQSIDLVAASESPDARPAWQEDIPRYSDADWYAPDVTPGPVDPPVPVPVPVPTPTPAPSDIARLEAKIDTLQVTLTQLLTAISDLSRQHLSGSVSMPYLGRGSADLTFQP